MQAKQPSPMGSTLCRTLGGPGAWRGTRNFPPIFKLVLLPTFHVSTKGQVGDLLSSVGSFHVRLHKKFICKWKEELSKVHQLRDHIGAHEYETVWLTRPEFSGDRESKIPLMEITYLGSNLPGCSRYLSNAFLQI